MQVVLTNGKMVKIPDASESKEMGTSDKRLVVYDSNGDELAFFVVENVAGYGVRDAIEPVNNNTN